MLVLASASPRRRAILQNAGIEFVCRPAERETPPENFRSPEEFVVKNALSKAKEAASEFGKGDIVLGADTIVYLDGEIIGKPADRKKAFEILKRLSGNTHKVYTGIALIKGEREVTGFEVTDVTFRRLDDEEIKAYIETGEPMDKAGAYGVQEKGSLFVSRIEGDFYNVVGLPLCRVYTAMKALN